MIEQSCTNVQNQTQIIAYVKSEIVTVIIAGVPIDCTIDCGVEIIVSRQNKV